MLKDFAVTQIVPPTSHSAGSLTTAAVDTKGFGTAIILVELGNSTSLGFSHCDLYSSDLRNETHEELLGSAVPGGTDPNEVLAFQVDLADAENRYLFLHLTLQGSGTAVLSVLALLLDPTNTPINTNLDEQILIP